jgi:hypothetical protein
MLAVTDADLAALQGTVFAPERRGAAVVRPVR